MTPTDGQVETINRAVQEQFGQTALAYATSTVHAKGADLIRLRDLAAPQGHEHVLDVGTAAGHTALTLAPHVAQVTGVDFTGEMLAIARVLATERGISNVAYVTGDAMNLPFADASFDLVTCRVCAHHFANVQKAVDEMVRVLVPGGRAVLCDNFAPEQPDLDEFINTVEKLRDPSHVRVYTVAEWRELFIWAGLTVEAEDIGDMELDFASWVARSQTPEPTVEHLRDLLLSASPAATTTFAIQSHPALHFSLRRLIIVGRKAS